jgi:hypothetical protein
MAFRTSNHIVVRVDDPSRTDSLNRSMIVDSGPYRERLLPERSSQTYGTPAFGCQLN